jgi:hypothetical protein
VASDGSVGWKMVLLTGPSYHCKDGAFYHCGFGSCVGKLIQNILVELAEFAQM